MKKIQKNQNIFFNAQLGCLLGCYNPLANQKKEGGYVRNNRA